MEAENTKLASSDFSRAVGYQMAVHAIGLAMQNAVAQQQHAYTLLNAITAAATQAVLESRTEDAREAIKLAREILDPHSIVETLNQLKKLLDKVIEESDSQPEPPLAVAEPQGLGQQ